MTPQAAQEIMKALEAPDTQLMNNTAGKWKPVSQLDLDRHADDYKVVKNVRVPLSYAQAVDAIGRRVRAVAGDGSSASPTVAGDVLMIVGVRTEGGVNCGDEDETDEETLTVKLDIGPYSYTAEEVLLYFVWHDTVKGSPFKADAPVGNLSQKTEYSASSLATPFKKKGRYSPDEDPDDDDEPSEGYA